MVVSPVAVKKVTPYWCGNAGAPSPAMGVPGVGAVVGEAIGISPVTTAALVGPGTVSPYAPTNVVAYTWLPGSGPVLPGVGVFGVGAFVGDATVIGPVTTAALGGPGSVSPYAPTKVVAYTWLPGSGPGLPAVGVPGCGALDGAGTVPSPVVTGALTAPTAVSPPAVRNVTP